MKRASATALLLCAVAPACGSCSSDASSVVVRDGGTDAQFASDDGGGSPADAASDASTSFNTDGWPALAGFDPACGFFVAPSPSAKNFPPPIAWESCDTRVRTADGGALACKQMADNWRSGVTTGNLPFGFTWSAFHDPTTQATSLAIERVANGIGVFIVADADGPVRQAIAATSPGCDLGTFSSISENNAIYNIEKYSSAHALISGGAVGGVFGTPRVLRSYANPGGLEYVAGASDFTEFGSRGFDTGSWVDGHQTGTVSTNAPGQPGEFQYQGDQLFFSVTDLNYGRVQLYTPASGVVDFISFGAVTTNYAADFGTDGTDMVWTEASGHPSGGANPWTTISTMTAQFTPDAGSIAKRRLRSQSTYGLGTNPFVVGCGYAAHQTSDSDGTGIRVIRISDGWSWRLLNSSVTWNAPVAISCTEVFVNINFGPTALNLARIRLDSLGPGEAAD